MNIKFKNLLNFLTVFVGIPVAGAAFAQNYTAIVNGATSVTLNQYNNPVTTENSNVTYTVQRSIDNNKTYTKVGSCSDIKVFPCTDKEAPSGSHIYYSVEVKTSGMVSQDNSVIALAETPPVPPPGLGWPKESFNFTTNKLLVSWSPGSGNLPQIYTLYSSRQNGKNYVPVSGCLNISKTSCMDPTVMPPHYGNVYYSLKSTNKVSTSEFLNGVRFYR
jgi:hypothetical protein